MAELSEAEARNIFNATSKALRDNDVEKLSTIMNEEAPIEEEQPIEQEPALTPKETEEEEPVIKDDKEEEVTPPEKEKAEKVEDGKEETKPEPTELEKLKEHIEKLAKENHALRSQAGRVPHVQRRIRELDRKLEELEKARTSPSSQPSAKITPKVQQVLKTVSETDPELADAIAKAIVAATEGVADETITSQQETLKLIRDNEVALHQQAEAQRLLEKYPNAAEVFASPSWAEWKKKQTDGIVRLAESDNADEVDYAFQRYAEDMLREHPELTKRVETKPAEAEDSNDKAKEQAQKVEAARQRTKETSVTVGSRPSPSKGGMPEDPEALFKMFSDKIRKDRLGG